jgi:hypothetical protein
MESLEKNDEWVPTLVERTGISSGWSCDQIEETWEGLLEATPGCLFLQQPNEQPLNPVPTVA